MRKNVRNKLKEQHPLTFTITGMSHEGRGIGFYGDHPDHNADKQGKKVFVAFALPGETVTAKVFEVRSKYEEADAVDISYPSPDRAEPICPHFTVCGGCSLQHIKPEIQVSKKQAILAEHLLHFGNLTPEQWLPALTNPNMAYRRKARLGVRYVHKKEKTLVGFRERKSGYLADLRVCKVLDAQIGERIEELKTCINNLSMREHIPQLELAIGDDNVAIIIRHMQALPESDVALLHAYFDPLGWQWYLQPAGYDSVVRMDKPNEPMRLHYSLPDFDVTFAFSPLDFTQVNAAINKPMVKLACDLLDLKKGERVLDLFCGLGNFSLPLARCVGEQGKVVAVEGSAEMVERGLENTELNNIHNVGFYAQDLTKDFSHHAWASEAFDALLIDPPRSGAEEVMHYLANFGAKRLVYVSCNPATLARDAGILATYGYKLKKAGVMDMFTHTSHVESIALFVKV